MFKPNKVELLLGDRNVNFQVLDWIQEFFKKQFDKIDSLNNLDFDLDISNYNLNSKYA